ncbi:hypothetical protein BJP36_36230 [Moorena producens JHB]|uniref:Uncharacterized protein n=1 Tax=Moorena producens (strain JHB) TaxID=1454205 RepID=A0A9Q9STW1_MOOP1|nr:hypothetical protein [Moorena producens]WAN69542.1 hypothetical protein BJP36_36230 [Moorena producens JHB]
MDSRQKYHKAWPLPQVICAYFNYEISATILSQLNKFPENQGFCSDIGSGLRTFMNGARGIFLRALGDTPWRS